MVEEVSDESETSLEKRDVALEAGSPSEQEILVSECTAEEKRATSPEPSPLAASVDRKSEKVVKATPKNTYPLKLKVTKTRFYCCSYQNGTSGFY